MKHARVANAGFDPPAIRGYIDTGIRGIDGFGCRKLPLPGDIVPVTSAAAKYRVEVRVLFDRDHCMPLVW